MNGHELPVPADVLVFAERIARMLIRYDPLITVGVTDDGVVQTWNGTVAYDLVIRKVERRPSVFSPSGEDQK